MQKCRKDGSRDMCMGNIVCVYVRMVISARLEVGEHNYANTQSVRLADCLVASQCK